MLLVVILISIIRSVRSSHVDIEKVYRELHAIDMGWDKWVHDEDNFVKYTGTVSHDVVDNFCEILKEVERDGYDHVNIFIDSTGGSADAGQKMMDCVTDLEIKTICYAGENLMSAATHSYFACDYRVADEKISTFLLHKPYIPEDSDGVEEKHYLEDEDLYDTAEKLYSTYIKSTCAYRVLMNKDTYCPKSKFTDARSKKELFRYYTRLREDIWREYDNEDYISANELKHFGLVDHIIR